MAFGACLFAACSSPTQNTTSLHAANLNTQTALATAEQEKVKASTRTNSTSNTQKKRTIEAIDSTAPKRPTVEPKNSPLFVPLRQEFVQEDGELSPYLKEWALDIAEQRRIPYLTIENLLKQVRYEPQVIQLMTPAKGKQAKRSWPAYRKRFTDQVRINKGLEFWQRHQVIIESTAQQYKVPASILVAIIGVETIYGNYMGDFSVLNALANLGFSYPDPDRPDRAAMFRNQLADLIELHYKEKLDAKTARGSFAGAMGLPQFMPTSIKNWAIDANEKGYIDLFKSVPDALASIANFLNHHGWQANLPVFVKVDIPNTHEVSTKVDGGLRPTLQWTELQPLLNLPEPSTIYAGQKLGLIDLPDQINHGMEYRLATANFFALTEYNRSYFYASAVADLACALEKRHYQRSNCSLWAIP